MSVLYLCGAQLRTSYSFLKIPLLCLGAALKVECAISAGLPQKKNASPPVSNPLRTKFVHLFKSGSIFPGREHRKREGDF